MNASPGLRERIWIGPRRPPTVPAPTGFLMQQTILALAAILTFSIYMLSRHGVEAEIERFAITAEVELAATDVATARLSTVLARAFDEADREREGTRTRPEGLSPIGVADPDETVEGQFDDVDDYHGVMRSSVRPWFGTDLVFTDSVSVRYVDPANPSATVASGGLELGKEITVTVFAAPAGYVGSPSIGAQIRQVVTPASQARYR